VLLLLLKLVFFIIYFFFFDLLKNIGGITSVGSSSGGVSTNTNSDKTSVFSSRTKKNKVVCGTIFFYIIFVELIMYLNILVR
jgi:hypothetical protein